MENFKGKVHMNFVAKETDIGPICVSVIKSSDTEYIALIRTTEGNKRVSVGADKIKVSFFRKLFKQGPANGAIIKALDPSLPANRLRLVKDPALIERLEYIEDKQAIRGFKFGILYAQPGQTKEDEMFATQETSPEYEEFLDFLGDRVPLSGWSKFRAGLDVKSGTTGEHGLYLKWRNNEIMYHVSTLLPFNKLDKQQLERKRHIGNDIVVIIFQDGDTVYRPTTISSRQVHVVFLVKAVKKADSPDKTFYRLAVVSKDGVPPFGLEIASGQLFEKGEAFKELFYHKLLNAERASYDAPILASKLKRTRVALLTDIGERFL